MYGSLLTCFFLNAFGPHTHYLVSYYNSSVLGQNNIFITKFMILTHHYQGAYAAPPSKNRSYGPDSLGTVTINIIRIKNTAAAFFQNKIGSGFIQVHKFLIKTLGKAFRMARQVFNFSTSSPFVKGIAADSAPTSYNKNATLQVTGQYFCHLKEIYGITRNLL